MLFFLAVMPAVAQWQPTAAHVQLRIWPGNPPDARAPSGGEYLRVERDDPVAGRAWTSEHNVTQPTITVYRPQHDASHAAVLVFPGGGYEELAMDLEGSEACDWITSRGITCILLKYRVPAPRWSPYWGAYPQSPIALEDAQRAMGLIRVHAQQWKLDPHRIGVLGFSAGGHLAAAVSTTCPHRIYAAVDRADAQSCRPDFAMLLYPGHLWVDERSFALNPTIHVTRATPPAFIVQARDDPVDSVNNALVYASALRAAGVPVALHVFAHGGHAFGLRRTSAPVTQWPRLAERWLKSIGVLR